MGARLHCRYQVCAFCYERLNQDDKKQCPGCRTEYGTYKVTHTEGQLTPPVEPYSRLAELSEQLSGLGESLYICLGFPSTRTELSIKSNLQ